MDRTGLCERDHSHALTNTTRFEYDPVGRLITTTAAIGRMTVNAYDNADHLIAVTNNYTTTSAQQNYRSAYNLITRYGYDGFGRQIAVTDTHGFVTRTGYDNLNRPVTVTQNYKGNGIFDPSKPDENVRRITRYDPAGNVVEQIDPLGNVTRNGYDSLNRVISTTTNYTTTPGVDPNTYNLTTRYEYDPAGNQVAITDTLQHVTRNYYDKVGRLISTTLILKDDSGEMMPSGQTGPFTSPLSTPAPFTSPLLPTSNLPPNGAPPPVFDPSLLIIAPVALAAVVARKKGRKGALFVAVLTGTLVIVSQAHTSGVASMPLPFVSPSPPPPGCTLPSAIGDTRVISYTYDPLYRLSQAAYSSGECYQYAYDRVGNRTVMTTTVGTTTYQYDPANRLSSVNGQTYTWDNNGNLINDGSALYRYDRANRLISTTLNSTTSLFNYNGDGVRLKQIVAGVVTTYTQDLVAPLPVMLQAKTGVTTTKYLYATATRPLAQNSTAWEYLLPDALGSVRQMASANAYIIRTQDYEPYGSLLNGSGSGQSTYGFTGEEHDTYMKLVFLRARYYSPETARFLSKDMWQGDYTRPQSLDGWSYVEGDPINLTDPSGQQTQCPVGRWDCDAVNKVAALKDAFLDSASRHNRVPTMDRNGFAALVASVIVSERKIGDVLIPGNPPRDLDLQAKEDAAAVFGCLVSGYYVNPAYQRCRQTGDCGQFLSYLLNLKIPDTDDLHAFASVGIGNIKLATAANLWKGLACSGSQGTDCVPVQINKLQTVNALGMLIDLPDPFGRQVACAMGNCATYEPTKLQSLAKLQRQLLDNNNNIEYIAANLEAGALRALSLNPSLQPSAFNLATWHLKGIQSDKEINDSRWRPCPYGPCLIVEEIQTALTIWDLTSAWNINMEPQYAYWKQK